LKDIKKSLEGHIVLDCDAELIYTVFKQAKEVNLLDDYHSFIITSLVSIVNAIRHRTDRPTKFLITLFFSPPIQGRAHSRLQRRRAKYTYKHNDRAADRSVEPGRGEHREGFELRTATNELEHSSVASPQADRQCDFDIRRGERVRQSARGTR
jgi:hypothetical protein